jgi:hypothetical protein
MEDFAQQSLMLMQTQTALINELAAAQDAVRNAVMNREWDEFDSLISTMNAYSEQFQSLEEKRAALFAALTEHTPDVDTVSSDAPVDNNTLEQTDADDSAFSDSTTFYAFASRLPSDERRELTGVYRDLKLRALRLRVASNSLMLYLNEAKGTVDGFINAAFPERKTNLYSRFGTRIAADMRCMVLNRVF